MHPDRCHALDELAPAAAIGALDRHEATAAGAHLRSCGRRHQLLGELTAVAAAIGGAVPDHARPDPDLRRRLLAAVRAEG